MTLEGAPPVEATLLCSIIITNYNNGRFVAAAIESALAQTYENREIIVNYPANLR